MKLTLEQFETQWTNSKLSVTDWFDTTYGLFKELEELQSRSCEGCKYRYHVYCPIRGLWCSRSEFYCNRYEAKDNK